MASIEKLKTGWRYRIRAKQEDGSWTNYSESGFRTKKEALEAAVEMDKRIGKSVGGIDMGVSLTDYFDEWYKRYKAGKVSASTMEWYQNTLRWIRRYFRNTELSVIRRSTYQDFITWLGTEQDYIDEHGDHAHKRALARASVQKMNSFIRSMVKDAQDDAIIDIDFTRKIQLVGAASKDPSEKFLSLADFNKLIELAKERANFKAITEYEILTQAYTGMRFEEVLGLTWDRIDFDHNTIKIDRSWDYRSNSGFAPLKNKPSYRSISIPDELATQLQKLHREQNEAFMANGYRDPDGLVFRNINGSLNGNNAINDTLKRLTSALGIKKITSHGLRHTHGSVLIYQGVSIMSVSRRLGHGDLQTTMSTYIHIIDEMKARDDEQIVSILEKLG